ncbi:hypothetical protein C8R46DRAFT_1024893 [Mycena filopes]|nr:hypothetical protein C8R46DRAFT_1024893 [Mycena filopes]
MNVLSKLPTECLVECLAEFMGCSHTDFAQFMKLRKTASEIDRRCRVVIQDHSGFWTHVVIAPYIPAQVSASWLARTAGAELDVEIIFKDLATRYPNEDPSPHVRAHLDGVLPAFLSSTDRWKFLRIEIEDMPCMSAVVLALRGRPGRALKALERVLDLDNKIAGGLPFAIFAGGVPVLTQLTVQFSDAAWKNTDCFHHLSSLDLTCPRLFRPTQRKTLVELLRTAHVLDHLRLDSAIVEGDIDGNILLPALRSIHLELTGIGGVAWLTGHLDAPALNAVTLVGQSVIHFADEAFPPTLFCGVEKLIIRDVDMSSQQHTRSLLAAFEFVKHLDVSGCTAAAGRTLRNIAQEDSDRSQECILLPRLKKLVVDTNVLDYLASWIESRMIPKRSLDYLHMGFQTRSNLEAAALHQDWGRILRAIRTTVFSYPQTASRM